MKNVFLFALTLLLTVHASAYITILKSDSEVGFHEDGFNSPKELCYVGLVNEVCGVVDRHAAELLEEYSSGAHGYIEVRSCTVNENEVNLIYQQITDYDSTSGLQPERSYTIAPCK